MSSFMERTKKGCIEVRFIVTRGNTAITRTYGATKRMVSYIEPTGVKVKTDCPRCPYPDFTLPIDIELSTYNLRTWLLFAFKIWFF